MYPYGQWPMPGVPNETSAKHSKSLERKKPGPKPTSIRLMFFLLPDGCEMPKFTTKDPFIEKLQSQGFGYPAHLYNDFVGKTIPVNLHLTEEEFKEYIRTLYPRLVDKDFSLYTLNSTKYLIPAPFKPSYFKEMTNRGSVYKGRVVIKIEGGCPWNENDKFPDQTPKELPADSQNIPHDEIQHLETATEPSSDLIKLETGIVSLNTASTSDHDIEEK